MDTRLWTILPLPDRLTMLWSIIRTPPFSTKEIYFSTVCCSNKTLKIYHPWWPIVKTSSIIGFVLLNACKTVAISLMPLTLGVGSQKIFHKWYYTPFRLASIFPNKMSNCWCNCSEWGTLYHTRWTCLVLFTFGSVTNNFFDSHLRSLAYFPTSGPTWSVINQHVSSIASIYHTCPHSSSIGYSKRMEI